jgi:hypothetical protein
MSELIPFSTLSSHFYSVPDIGQEQHTCRKIQVSRSCLEKDSRVRGVITTRCSNRMEPKLKQGEANGAAKCSSPRAEKISLYGTA